MDSIVPRRYKVRYAATLADEIIKNVQLDPGETILYSLLARQRTNWLLAEPRMLAITPYRLVILEHNFFSADWILEIPRPVVTNVASERTMINAWVNLTYVDSGASCTISLQPMTRTVSESNNRELLDLLSAFHRGELSTFQLPEPSAV